MIGNSYTSIDVHIGEVRKKSCLCVAIDVYYVFCFLLTRRRVTTLLSPPVCEGRLIREDSGAQTRYRQAKA